MKRIELGRVAGLRLTAHPSAWVTLLVMWVVLSLIAVSLLGLPVGESIVGAFVAAVLHYASEMVHQLGHSIAARRTGYPMTGVAFWGPLGLSIYPKDEPPLAGRIHIKRALGGPLLSLALTCIAALLYLYASGTFTVGSTEPHLSPVIVWVSFFFFIDNLLVFTLGAFLPLGFTDGSTILRWWGK